MTASTATRAFASRLLTATRARVAQILGLPGRPFNYRPRDPALIDDDVRYALRSAHDMLDYLAARHGAGHFAGLTVLELGPGANFAPQLALAGQGAKVMVADRFLAPWDEGYHPELYRRFLAAWGQPCPALEAVINSGGYPPEAITLIREPAENLASVPDQSVDVVLSNAVLEHVVDLDAVIRELARITKPGGSHSHQIDFRDHRNFQRPLEFLLIDDRKFARLIRMSSGQTGNRRRATDVAHTFEHNGFQVDEMQITETASPAYLADFIPRLRASGSRFKDLAQDELTKLSARFLLRRAPAQR